MPKFTRQTAGKLADMGRFQHIRVRNLHFEMPIMAGGMVYLEGG